MRLAEQVVLAHVPVVDLDLQAHLPVDEVVQVVLHRPDHAVVEDALAVGDPVVHVLVGGDIGEM